MARASDHFAEKAADTEWPAGAEAQLNEAFLEENFDGTMLDSAKSESNTCRVVATPPRDKSRQPLARHCRGVSTRERRVLGIAVAVVATDVSSAAVVAVGGHASNVAVVSAGSVGVDLHVTGAVESFGQAGEFFEDHVVDTHAVALNEHLVSDARSRAVASIDGDGLVVGRRVVGSRGRRVGPGVAVGGSRDRRLIREVEHEAGVDRSASVSEAGHPNVLVTIARVPRVRLAVGAGPAVGRNSYVTARAPLGLKLDPVGTSARSHQGVRAAGRVPAVVYWRREVGDPTRAAVAKTQATTFFSARADRALQVQRRKVAVDQTSIRSGATDQRLARRAVKASATYTTSSIRAIVGRHLNVSAEGIKSEPVELHQVDPRRAVFHAPRVPPMPALGHSDVVGIENTRRADEAGIDSHVHGEDRTQAEGPLRPSDSVLGGSRPYRR